MISVPLYLVSYAAHITIGGLVHIYKFFLQKYNIYIYDYI